MMTTSVEEKRTIWTGNVELDEIIPLLNENELERLADYAKDLRGSHIDDNYDEDDDDGSWADLPLTEEEEAQLAIGRENAKNGKYITLAEFKESQRCGQ